MKTIAYITVELAMDSNTFDLPSFSQVYVRELAMHLLMS